MKRFNLWRASIRPAWSGLAMSVLLVKLRRPTLASRFLSEQVGVRQASQIGFSKPPFSESLVDDLRSLSCLTYRLTAIRCCSP